MKTDLRMLIKKQILKTLCQSHKVNLAKMYWFVACMDFGFIGGSMGSVVGEKISRSIDFCIKNKTPLLIISKSGGARMMESAFFFDANGKNSC
jgi:acetyl-CoA carboxylase carboxyl transferase subunit beta